MFLVGSAIGSRYGAAIERGDVVPFARRLIRISAILAIASIPLVAIWAMLRWHVAGAASYTLKYIFFPDRFFSLFPASIAAVLTFLAATILRLERGTPPGFVGRMLLILGKTSLFTYVIQYLFVETIPYSLGLQGAMGPTLYVVWTLVSCGLVFLAAEQWNRRFKKA